MPLLVSRERALEISREVEASMARVRAESEAGDDFLFFPEEPMGSHSSRITDERPGIEIKPPHRVRPVYRSQWLDGPFAITAGILTLIIGLVLGDSAMGLFCCGFLAFLAGLVAAEICDWFDILIKHQPVFTFANRLYAALRRYARTRTTVIHTRYRVGQRVEVVGTGCASIVTEIAAHRGKIYYRLYGFDYDYREGELCA